MKLQDQVCTLEQGQRLQELGVKEPATFHWMPGKDGPHDQPYVRFGWHGDSLAPAYTAAELEEMVPADIPFPLRFAPKRWCLPEIEGMANRHRAYDAEAQALADLVIYLMETGLIEKPEESLVKSPNS